MKKVYNITLGVVVSIALIGTSYYSYQKIHDKIFKKDKDEYEQLIEDKVDLDKQIQDLLKPSAEMNVKFLSAQAESKTVKEEYDEILKELKEKNETLESLNKYKEQKEKEIKNINNQILDVNKNMYLIKKEIHENREKMRVLTSKKENFKTNPEYGNIEKEYKEKIDELNNELLKY